MIFKDPKSRRMFLKFASFQLALPFLASALPKHLRAAPSGKKFIGVFFPNGVYMPSGNGVWHWNNQNGLLHTFKENSDIHKNIMIVRNLSGFSRGMDLHFSNTASFLSAKYPRMGSVQQPKVGESLDQMLAKQSAKPIKSIVIPPIRDENVPRNGLSSAYLNRISWSSALLPTTPINSPQALFNRIIGISPPQQQILTSSKELYKLDRKKLILDTALTQLKPLRSSLGKEDSYLLQEFENSFEEIIVELNQEKQNLNKTKPACESSPPNVPASLNYTQRMRLFQKLIVHAMKCDLTDVATIMYSPGFSGRHLDVLYPEIGNTHLHHGLSHYTTHQEPLRSTLIKQYNELSQHFLNLLKELLIDLKQNNLLDDTLVLYSSNMATGPGHIQHNYPTLVAGGSGSKFKFGQDVDISRQPRSNLLYTIAKELNVKNGQIKLNDFGDNEIATTGLINNIYRS